MSIEGYWFDCASALFAGISAYVWWKSARVTIPVGHDCGSGQKDAFERVAKLNANAANFAACAAFVPALKALGVVFKIVIG